MNVFIRHIKNYPEGTNGRTKLIIEFMLKNYGYPKHIFSINNEKCKYTANLIIYILNLELSVEIIDDESHMNKYDNSWFICNMEVIKRIIKRRHLKINVDFLGSFTLTKA